MTKSLLHTVYQNSDHLLSEVESLLVAGADPNAITEYSESPLRVASNNGRFDVIKLLLDRGADKSQLGWTNLFHVIAYGTINSLEEVVTGGCDLEARDFWSRTPFLFSILVGDTKKVAMLLEAGANRSAVGRCGKTPLGFAIQNDDVNMLNWLAEHRFDPEQKNEFGDTPLIEAAEQGATKCIHALLNNGVDIHAENNIPEQAIMIARNPEIVAALLKAGADINDINKETRAELLGYQVDKVPDISEKDYFEGKKRVFGKTNPELAKNPFWYAMVRCGGSAYHATSKFDKGRDIFKDGPVWSFDRFGKSITPLPKGHIIEIAGEHEDSYDPDFCIYNDVFVHDGKGHCDIYSYPREIFPPTDFHTATLVNNYIYVIGNLGYEEDRKPGYTQLFRLNIDTLKMERIETKGETPGWISRHKVSYDGQSTLIITGGKLIVNNNGEEDYIDNKDDYTLCLNSMVWNKMGFETIQE